MTSSSASINTLLSSLTRKELQSLAKLHEIKANQSSSLLIQQFITVYPCSSTHHTCILRGSKDDGSNSVTSQEDEGERRVADGEDAVKPNTAPSADDSDEEPSSSAKESEKADGDGESGNDAEVDRIVSPPPLYRRTMSLKHLLPAWAADSETDNDNEYEGEGNKNKNKGKSDRQTSNDSDTDDMYEDINHIHASPIQHDSQSRRQSKRRRTWYDDIQISTPSIHNNSQEVDTENVDHVGHDDDVTNDNDTKHGVAVMSNECPSLNNSFDRALKNIDVALNMSFGEDRKRSIHTRKSYSNSTPSSSSQSTHRDKRSSRNTVHRDDGNNDNKQSDISFSHSAGHIDLDFDVSSVMVSPSSVEFSVGTINQSSRSNKHQKINKWQQRTQSRRDVLPSLSSYSSTLATPDDVSTGAQHSVDTSNHSGNDGDLDDNDASVQTAFSSNNHSVRVSDTVSEGAHTARTHSLPRIRDDRLSASASGASQEMLSRTQLQAHQRQQPPATARVAATATATLHRDHKKNKLQATDNHPKSSAKTQLHSNTRISTHHRSASTVTSNPVKRPKFDLQASLAKQPNYKMKSGVYKPFGSNEIHTPSHQVKQSTGVLRKAFVTTLNNTTNASKQQASSSASSSSSSHHRAAQRDNIKQPVFHRTVLTDKNQQINERHRKSTRYNQLHQIRKSVGGIERS